jgi:hypothetical protein
MAFISFNTRVAEHRTRLVCLGESPSPRVRCRLALFTYLLTTGTCTYRYRCVSRLPRCLFTGTGTGMCARVSRVSRVSRLPPVSFTGMFMYVF